MPKSVLISRIFAITVVAGSVAYCKYNEYVMNREVDAMLTKIKEDQQTLRTNMKNLGNN